MQFDNENIIFHRHNNTDVSILDTAWFGMACEAALLSDEQDVMYQIGEWQKSQEPTISFSANALGIIAGGIKSARDVEILMNNGSISSETAVAQRRIPVSAE